VESVTRDRTIAFALGGLAGNNAHGAGFLYAAAKRGLKPKMISCTSGQIAWLYYYLQSGSGDLREVFERDVAEMHRWQNINLDYTQLVLGGKQGVFRPAFPEYPFDLARNMIQAYSDMLRQQGNVFWMETMLRTLPGRMLVPTLDQDRLDHISQAFTNSKIGIAFNSYDPQHGQEVVHLNQAARDMLAPDKRAYQPGDASKHRGERTRYEDITQQAVLDGLWIYQYGFDKPGSNFVDGAYYRQIMLTELTRVNTIFAVRPISSRWLGETSSVNMSLPTAPNRTGKPALPRSAIGIEDLKTEVNFNGSYAGERAQIALINKLVQDRDEYLANAEEPDHGTAGMLAKYQHIDLLEVEIQIPRSFFDYVFESMAVFDAAGHELDRVLKEAAKRGLHVG
jgi:hypothetical protein